MSLSAIHRKILVCGAIALLAAVCFAPADKWDPNGREWVVRHAFIFPLDEKRFDFDNLRSDVYVIQIALVIAAIALALVITMKSGLMSRFGSLSVIHRKVLMCGAIALLVAVCYAPWQQRGVPVGRSFILPPEVEGYLSHINLAAYVT